VLLQDREKKILAIASVILVITVFWFIFRPAFEKHAELKTTVSTLEDQINNSKITPKSLGELKDKLGLLDDEITALLQQLPTTEKRGFLIRDIENLARASNIEINSFVPKDAVPVTMSGKEIKAQMTRARAQRMQLEEQHAKVLKTVSNIDAAGKFDRLTKFLTDIITYYRAVEVTDISITRAGIAQRSNVDKRFGGGGGIKDPLAEAKNTNLNVTFTLIAYTAINQESN